MSRASGVAPSFISAASCRTTESLPIAMSIASQPSLASAFSNDSANVTCTGRPSFSLKYSPSFSYCRWAYPSTHGHESGAASGSITTSDKLVPLLRQRRASSATAEAQSRRQPQSDNARMASPLERQDLIPGNARTRSVASSPGLSAVPWPRLRPTFGSLARLRVERDGFASAGSSSTLRSAGAGASPGL